MTDVNANVGIGKGTLYIKNPYTEASWTEVGNCEGAALMYSRGGDPVRVDWETFPIDDETLTEDMILEVSLAAINVSALTNIFPGASAVVAGVISFTNSAAKKVGIKYSIPVNISGKASVDIEMPYCSVISQPKPKFVKNKKHEYVAQFMAMRVDNSTAAVTITEVAS